MHRKLGHPSVEKHMKVIESARFTDIPEGTRKQIAELVYSYKDCQLGRRKPKRLLLSIKDPETVEFNHALQVDVMKLADGNVLHVVCMGTRFQQGRFIDDMSARTAWETLRQCWINVLAGSPYLLVHDPGTNFNSKEFRNAAQDLRIVVKCLPMEAHELLGKVERSHATVHSVYQKLSIDLPDITRDEPLSLTFRALKDVPDSDTGICPTTMVFGVHPQIPGSSPRGSMEKRVKIIR